jgi:excisionase family DNA binding protein
MKDWGQVESRLRLLVRNGDPAGTVTIRWLAELLGEPIEGDALPGDDLPGDLTVYEVAEHFRRAPSTIRGWLYQGNLRGYKLNGRDWRVPRSAIAEFEQRQREPEVEPFEDVDLSSWRRM